MAYLDNDGLLYFWQQIKAKFATKADVDERLNGKADATHKHAIADTTGLQAALDGKADKATTLAGYGIADAYTKAQTDSAISNAVSGLYRYKGSVASVDKLPASPATGDVYNIETASKYGAAGANVAWNGSAWDSLGEVFSVSAISNTEIDGILTK